MPLTTWTTKATSVALPKTYHQLAVSRGTRCVTTSASGSPSPTRCSSQSPIARHLDISDTSRQRRQLPALHPQLAALDLELIAVERTRGRPRGMAAVGVEHAAVARAHEQLRRGEPANGADEVGAVDGEQLELVARQPAYPARDVGGLPVPRPRERVAVRGEPGLVLGEVRQRSERDPFLPAPAARGGEDEADERDREQRRRDGIQREAEEQQHPAPARLASFVAHAPPPRCEAM